MPQFLLKNFSCHFDKKTIGVYNLSKNIFLPCKSSTSGQAQKDYFYGKESSMEDLLGNLENIAGRIFKNIIESDSLPAYGTDEYAHMHIFSMIQASRTKYNVEEYNEFINLQIKSIYKHHDSFKGIIDGIEFGVKDAPLQVLQHAFDSMSHTYDLYCKLFVNETGHPFVLSDHPAVKYNQYLKYNKVPDTTCGFASLGLQLVLPISPRHLLLFYDENVYRVGAKNFNEVKLTHRSQIDIFNILQYLNCNENIYFNELMKEDWNNNIVNRYQKHRRTDKNQYEEFRIGLSGERYLTKTTGSEINVKLGIPNCTFTNQAKSFKIDNSRVYVRPRFNNSDF